MRLGVGRGLERERAQSGGGMRVSSVARRVPTGRSCLTVFELEGDEQAAQAGRGWAGGGLGGWGAGGLGGWRGDFALLLYLQGDEQAAQRRTGPARLPTQQRSSARRPTMAAASSPGGGGASGICQIALAVFDESLGQRDGQEADKLLAFFPQSTPVAARMSVVGLAQAVASFAASFADEVGV
jgi:hypothetical protein